MTRNDRDSLRFAKRIAPGGSVELSHKMDEAATVEECRVRFYVGSENDLEIQPWIKHGGEDSQKTSILVLEGKQYIDGDGDYFKFPVTASARPGDVLGVDVDNTEQSYGYDFSVDMELEYMGGVERVVGNLVSGLRGVI